MKATITSIKLKGPFKFFALSAEAMHILKQLKATNCKDFKKTGFWTTHYTMTLWASEDEMNAFAKSGAHLEAMKKSARIAEEIRTLTIEAKELPNWQQAKEQLVAEGRLIRYS